MKTVLTGIYPHAQHWEGSDEPPDSKPGLWLYTNDQDIVIGCKVWNGCKWVEGRYADLIAHYDDLRGPTMTAKAASTKPLDTMNTTPNQTDTHLDLPDLPDLPEYQDESEPENNAVLVLTGAQQVALSVSAEARIRKTAALDKAAMVGEVTNATTLSIAADAMRDVSAIISEVEKSRKAVKAPFLDWGRKIDATAATFVAELKTEQVRVATEIGNYETEQRIIRERAEAAAQAERERIEREAREAQLAALRRQAAVEAEANRLAALAKTPEQVAAVESIRADAAALAELDMKLAEERRKEEAESVAVAPVAERPKGIVIREDWDFEVVDMVKLVRARYDLVRVEPNRSAIKDALDAGVREIPGLRVFRKTGVSSRTGIR